MVRISTFVFFDLETTGLPHQEQNRTKIVELTFVAATRNDIKRYIDSIPPISKLSFLLNPQKTIRSAEITGITNDMVKYSPTFKEKFNTMRVFLDDLTKPVCLVAHNGNMFDYKILLAECNDANVSLPEDLYCSDSLPLFKKIFKEAILKASNTHKPTPVLEESTSKTADPEITDDEDDWPDLNVTPEEFEEIDDLCLSLSNISCSSVDGPKNAPNKPKAPENYKLTSIYKCLLEKEPENAHRAEADCLMLLQCVGSCKQVMSVDFLRLIDDNCKKLTEIKPLIRK